MERTLKKKVLFLIHDLGPGGAEKVLVNLVNSLDKNIFDVSLRTLFNWGPNRDLLNPDVNYSCWINRNVPANSYWMKLRSPQQLYRQIIPESYDVVVSFLEGPCARVVGGAPNSINAPKILSWIHTPILNEKKFTEGFRSKAEAAACYARADALVFVSHDVQKAFLNYFEPQKRSEVLYNIFESDKIRSLSSEMPSDVMIDPLILNWCGVGKLLPLKGWNRMLKMQKRLLDERIPTHFYVIGEGPQRQELEKLASALDIADSVTFTGYQMNPYSILARCLVFVCASEREGLSTAAVESLLVGTPVCTVNVGGMKEILGEHNEYGVVTENDDEALYQAIKLFLTDPDHRMYYQKKAAERAAVFDKARIINEIESLLLSFC